MPRMIDASHILHPEPSKFFSTQVMGNLHVIHATIVHAGQGFAGIFADNAFRM